MENFIWLRRLSCTPTHTHSHTLRHAPLPANGPGCSKELQSDWNPAAGQMRCASLSSPLRPSTIKAAFPCSSLPSWPFFFPFFNQESSSFFSPSSGSTELKLSCFEQTRPFLIVLSWIGSRKETKSFEWLEHLQNSEQIGYVLFFSSFC